MCTKIYLHVTVNTTICAPVYHKLVAQSILVSGCSGQEQSKQLLPVKAGVRKMHCCFPPLRPHSPGSVQSEWRQTRLFLTNRVNEAFHKWEQIWRISFVEVGNRWNLQCRFCIIFQLLVVGLDIGQHCLLLALARLLQSIVRTTCASPCACATCAPPCALKCATCAPPTSTSTSPIPNRFQDTLYCELPSSPWARIHLEEVGWPCRLLECRLAARS